MFPDLHLKNTQGLLSCRHHLLHPGRACTLPCAGGSGCWHTKFLHQPQLLPPLLTAGQQDAIFKAVYFPTVSDTRGGEQAQAMLRFIGSCGVNKDTINSNIHHCDKKFPVADTCASPSLCHHSFLDASQGVQVCVQVHGQLPQTSPLCTMWDPLALLPTAFW